LTTSLIDPKGSFKMNLMHEDLARAHISARLAEARDLRRSRQLHRSRRWSRRDGRPQ
jgi:hypothetical protein